MLAGGVTTATAPQGREVLAVLPSQSAPGVAYTLTLERDGGVACSCPSFRFRGGPCKHIKRLARLLLPIIVAPAGGGR